MGIDEGMSSELQKIHAKLDTILEWIQSQGDQPAKNVNQSGLPMAAISMLVETTNVSEIARTIGVPQYALHRQKRFSRFRDLLNKIRKGEHL